MTLFVVSQSLLCFLLSAWLAHFCSSAGVPSAGSEVFQGNVGKRLFLTPYIENGEIFRARELSRVPTLLGTVESYSGFLTVNERRGSNLFFWFFPAENNPHQAPVALWLQGGPGASSLMALFTENGPLVVNDELLLERRSSYWSQELNVLYIDNPVGTGFSFTKTGYATEQTTIGRDLYSALIQFFQLFPEFKQNDFFVTGESYGGKYVPALAYTIYKENPTALEKINLKGIAIGNGLVDPENMMKYGDYLYQHGLIDSTTLEQFHDIESNVVSNIRAGKFEEAYTDFDKLVLHTFTKYPTLYQNTTGFNEHYNYITERLGVDPGDYYNQWLAKPQNRRAIHVGSQTFDNGTEVARHLKADVLKTVKPWLEVLIDNYRVLLYNGQLDIICAYPLTMNYVKTMNWTGKADYEKAERKLWHVNGELAGYVKSAGNFTEILVRNAGHMVPADQPLWALDMITKFTQNIPF